MPADRKDFLMAAGGGVAIGLAVPWAQADIVPVWPSLGATGCKFDVRLFGAEGDDKTVPIAAINRAMEEAVGAAGGTVIFPVGTYPSYSNHLKSNVGLYLDSRATVLRAATLHAGTTTVGYGATAPNPATTSSKIPVTADTNGDGMDFNSCRYGRIVGCKSNSP